MKTQFSIPQGRISSLVLSILFIGLGGCESNEVDDTSEPTSVVEYKTGTNTGCETDDECKDGEYCDSSLSICRKGCNDNEDCGEDLVCNLDENVCVSCLTDSDCDFGVCHPSFKSCVGCYEDDQCASGACLESVLSCVQCESDADCAEGVCIESEYMCRQCGDDTDCDDGDPCTLNRCKDYVCEFPDVTDTIGCFGVECLESSDCPSPDVGCAVCEEGRCGVKLGEVLCESSEDCSPPGEKACFVAECKAQSCGGASCFYSLIPNCTDCVTDEDCDLGGQDCSASCVEGVCTTVSIGDEDCECILDADCVAGGTCSVGTCVDHQCQYETFPDGTLCDNGDTCSIGDTCVDGLCTTGTSLAGCGNTCLVDEDCGLNTLGCSGGCVEGICLYPPLAGKCPTCEGTADCDDGNPCTEEKCNQGLCITVGYPVATACDDKDPCTVSDQCMEGECIGYELEGCPGECLEASDCEVPAEGVCDVTCENFACSYTPLNPSCPKDCPTAEPCFEVKCVDDPCGPACSYAAIEGCTPCTDDSQCEPSGPCWKGYCDKESSQCVSIPLTGITCDDGSACTGPGKCESGKCTTGNNDFADAVLICEDGNPCTLDDCDPDTGCVFDIQPGAPCDDGDPCTLDDSCDIEGNCTHESGSPLIDGSCGEPMSPCQPSSSCSTGEPCGGSDVCTCVSTCPECDDCIGKVCAPPNKVNEEELGETGSVTTEEKTYFSCQESTQQACLESESCACVPSCPDCNDCIEIVCWAGGNCKGCTEKSDCHPCEVCDKGACIETPECDSKCTKDEECGSDPCAYCTPDGLCSEKAGCTVCEENKDCNGDACETCKENICVPSPPVSCTEVQCASPIDPCVTVECQELGCFTECVEIPIEGCTPADTKSDCLSASPCAVDAACEDGVCTNMSNVACDDGNECTLDVCQIDGCSFSNKELEGAPCEDGDACYQSQCLEGICQPTAPVQCDAEQGPCIQASCDPDVGCQVVSVVNGTPCSDGNACTVGDSCQNGNCSPGFTKLCAGTGESCVSTTCNPDTGFCDLTSSNDGEACETGNPCVPEGMCSDFECVPDPDSSTGVDECSLEDVDPCGPNAVCQQVDCSFVCAPKQFQGICCQIDDGLFVVESDSSCVEAGGDFVTPQACLDTLVCCELKSGETPKLNLYDCFALFGTPNLNGECD